MEILELMEQLEKAADGAAVQICGGDEQIALVLVKNGMKVKRIWSAEMLKLLQAPPASPEKMMIEAAAQMAAALGRASE